MEKENKDSYYLINNLIRIILIINIIPFVIKEDYMKIIYILITLVLTFYDVIVKKFLKIKLSNPLKYAILFQIITTEFLGSTIGFYDRFNWWDTFVHGMSGVMNFFLGLELINKLNENLGKEKTHNVIQILFAISFSLAILGLWEIAEFIIDEVTGLNMQITQGLVGQEAIWDTIEDMIAATIGTIVGTLMQTIALKQIKNKSKIS